MRATAPKKSPGGGATSPTWKPDDPMSIPGRAGVGNTRDPKKATLAKKHDPLNMPGRAFSPNFVRPGEASANLPVPKRGAAKGKAGSAGAGAGSAGDDEENG